MTLGQQPKSPLKQGLAHGAAVMATTALLQPLEVLKGRLQVVGSSAKFRKIPAAYSSGIMSSIYRTKYELHEVLDTEGLNGLYRGMSANLIASSVSWAMFRFIREACRASSTFESLVSDSMYKLQIRDVTSDQAKSLKSTKQSTQHSKLLLDAKADSRRRFRVNTAAGLVAGAFSTTVTQPLWFVKGRMEMSPNLVEYCKSSAKIETNETPMRDKKLAPKENDARDLAEPEMAAPLDKLPKLNFYRFARKGGIIDNFILQFKSEGFLGFWKGFGPSLALVPHAVIHSVIYEELMGLSRRARLRIKAKRDIKKAKNQNKRKDFVTPIRYPIAGSETLIAVSKTVFNTVGSATPDLGPFVWGSVAKFCATLITYPLQVLRTRQQNLSFEDNKNFVSLANEIVRESGVKSLFSGIGVQLQKSCLQAGLTHFFFEGFLGTGKTRRRI